MMTTTLPDSRSASDHDLPEDTGNSSGAFLEPGRRLSPSPGGDRPWRLLLTLFGAAFVVLLLVGLSATSVRNWAVARNYTEVPATMEVGMPSSLTLTSQVADVRVLHSADAEQVSVALVEDGATDLPPAGSEVRARFDENGTADAPALDVRQPEQFSTVPWDSERRDVLVVVPDGHELALNITAEVGEVRADGEFSALTITTNVGSVELSSVSAPEGLFVSSDLGDIEIELDDVVPAVVDISSAVGDIDLRLPTDAESDVSIRTELGSADVAIPGSGRWNVEARADLGEPRVDPSLTSAGGPILGTLTVTSEVGDVAVTR